MAQNAAWQAALDYLYGFVNWETKAAGVRPAYQLDRIRTLLTAVGEPQRAWPAVHVGGTNGKGSTCAMIASALQAAGYRVGLYTSPHMHTVRERVQVDSRPIAEAEVLAWIARRRDLLAQHAGVTTFEALTLLAFEHFARSAVDVAVVEVGLGGRLDTTRVVQPVVTIMASIGMDHREVLGDTLRQIASDKVGIFRPGVPIISAPQEPEALAVVQAEAERMVAPLTLVGRDATWGQVAIDRGGQRFAVTVREGEGGGEGGGREVAYDVATVLHGPHQRINATVAVAVLDALRRAGWHIDAAAVQRGIAAARWPGRFERLGPPPGDRDIAVIADGAHNPPAIAALLATLAEVYPTRQRTIVILGIGGEKDRAEMLAALVPAADIVFTARADHPKAVSAAALADEVVGAGGIATARANPSDALDAALAAAEPGDVVLATGSIFLAADVREAAADRGWLRIEDRDPPTSERPAVGKKGVRG